MRVRSSAPNGVSHLARSTGAWVLGLTLALAPRLASAQTQDDSTGGRAVELFESGVALSSEQRFDEACPRFAKSNRLYPRAETLLHLGDCLEQNQKLASAHAAYREAARVAEEKSDPNKATADARISSLEPRVSRLTVDMPPATRAPQLELTRDGVPFDVTNLGVALMVDGGLHRVTAGAPGYEPWSTEVWVDGEGAAVRIAVPPLTPLSSSSAGAAASQAIDPALIQTGEPGAAHRALGYVALGVGAAGLVTGTVFTFARERHLTERDQICPGDVCPADSLASSQAQVDELTKKARAASTGAAVSFIVGGVGIAAGAILLLTVPKAAPPVAGVRIVPFAGPRVGGVSVSGGF